MYPPRSAERVSADEPDFGRLRSAAADFCRLNGLPAVIERALNELFLRQPEDVHGYLAENFLKLSAPPRISRLRSREVFDARGQLSIEAELLCTVCNKEKSMSSAAVASYLVPKETSVDQASESQERADHVTTAALWINGALSSLLTDLNPCDQSETDQRLSNYFRTCFQEEKDTRDREKQESLTSSSQELELPSPPPTQTKDKIRSGKKSRETEKPFRPAEPPKPVLRGSMAIGSVSLAVAKAGAHVQGLPLYRYVADLRNQKAPKQFHIPVPLVTLLSCGKTSPGKLCLLEEIILVPRMGQKVKQTIRRTLELQKEMMRIMNASTKAGATHTFVSASGAPAASYDRPEQPLDLIAEACTNLGVALGTDVYLALNCAAQKLVNYSKGKYEVATGGLRSPDELVDFYHTLISKYPAVVALIDPFRKEDTEQWQKLSNVMGNSCSLLCDISHKLQPPHLPGVRGFIIKQVNETTVSDLIHITTEYQDSVLMGTVCSEPCADASFSDMAVGLGLQYVKLGGLSGAERMTKYNRLISIEEELAQQGILVYKEKHSPPLFPETPQELPATAE
ncbi:enolase 4 [Kryptolebias marmoratus]|uniref:enolase 4 n=1 Tax=Kryptolebias marmoratus TaxID=37003 RepID=UPI000D52F353|nr:enolase 4 [Kryptolebias marmoratus]